MWNCWRACEPKASSRAAVASAASGQDACAASPTTVHDAVPAAAADHPPLHGREVLGLVDEDVGVLVGLADAAGEELLARVGQRRAVRRSSRRGADDRLHLGDAVLAEVLELLDLVEAALLLGRLLHRADPRGDVVDERDVGHRPRAGLEGEAERGGQRLDLVVPEGAAGVAAHELGVGRARAAPRAGRPAATTPA